MPQVEPAHYFQKNYLTLERFISYYYQINLIRGTNAKRILLIGVGDGIVPWLLKRSKLYDVTTLDFDENLNPDVVGDVKKLEFPDNSFDLVCAFEVLEHLPIEESEKALSNMARVSSRHVVISVPHRRSGFEMVLKFPGIRTLIKRDFIRLGFLFPLHFKGIAESGQHYWEIDRYTTPLRYIRTILSKNFIIQSEATPVLDSYHRFFSLTKK